MLFNYCKIKEKPLGQKRQIRYSIWKKFKVNKLSKVQVKQEYQSLG
jgi:hypothetical protein